MAKMETRTFRIDGDTVSVAFRFDENWKVWLGDYPYFDEEARHTPSGRPWRNVIHEGCPHASVHGEICGACSYLRRQSPGDLIGVCFHDALRGGFCQLCVCFGRKGAGKSDRNHHGERHGNGINNLTGREAQVSLPAMLFCKNEGGIS